MTTSPVQPDNRLTCRWCREPAEAEAVARFFVAHADPVYISHSELQLGRASSPEQWSDTLGQDVHDQTLRAAGNDLSGEGTHLVLASEGGTMVGLAFVSFSSAAVRRFATLEDLLIAPAARGRGIGETLLHWLETECRRLGVHRLFLESGRTNHAAHRFFERHGFTQTSVVMMRDL